MTPEENKVTELLKGVEITYSRGRGKYGRRKIMSGMHFMNFIEFGKNIVLSYGSTSAKAWANAKENIISNQNNSK